MYVCHQWLLYCIPDFIVEKKTICRCYAHCIASELIPPQTFISHWSPYYDWSPMLWVIAMFGECGTLCYLPRSPVQSRNICRRSYNEVHTFTASISIWLIIAHHHIQFSLKMFFCYRYKGFGRWINCQEKQTYLSRLVSWDCYYYFPCLLGTFCGALRWVLISCCRLRFSLV